MANGLQKGVPENLKKQLALAVKNIQWSYAIFWSISSEQPGALVWADGYYNGDIKTRKAIQATEVDDDQMGFHRSEQLRELFMSLSSPQSTRPSAALTLEDLTDLGWYYLVCMSFVFDIGQGLPGRTFVNEQPMWICGAQVSDSKVFSRYLLAKTASIQTVSCFPFMGGVVELGVTKPIVEDASLIQHIKTFFLEIDSSAVNTINEHTMCSVLEHENIDTEDIPGLVCEELDMASPTNSSNRLDPEGINEEVRGPNSARSFDCRSKTALETENQESIDTKLFSLDHHASTLHHQRIISTLLKKAPRAIQGAYFQTCHQKSSFLSWNKVERGKKPKPRHGTSQNMLKKVLFEVSLMHSGGLPEPSESTGQNGVWKPEPEKGKKSHALSEKRRREKLKERFNILRSLVPSISKDDKVSLLDDLIEYLQKLESRVKELESCKTITESGPRTKRTFQDTLEQTSNNSGKDKTGKRRKLRPCVTKMKGDGVDEIEREINYLLSNFTDDVNVCISKRDVQIEMKCASREGLLLEIIDVVSNLHLDALSVESSTADGFLSLTIKFKFKTRSSVALAGMIKQALGGINEKQ